jgi:hypothetical protein
MGKKCNISSIICYILRRNRKKLYSFNTEFPNRLKAGKGLSPFLTIRMLTIILLFKLCRFITKCDELSGLAYESCFLENLFKKHL